MKTHDTTSENRIKKKKKKNMTQSSSRMMKRGKKKIAFQIFFSKSKKMTIKKENKKIWPRVPSGVGLGCHEG